jgi:hypothetical protein
VHCDQGMNSTLARNHWIYANKNEKKREGFSEEVVFKQKPEEWEEAG